LAGGLAAFLTVAVVIAQDAPPEEYVAAMTTIRTAMQTFNADEPDFEAIQAAGTEARAAFQYVQTFWNDRDDTEAADLAATGAREAASVVASADLMSAEGVQFAAAAIGETCGACHMAHRTRLEGGGFVIN